MICGNQQYASAVYPVRRSPWNPVTPGGFLAKKGHTTGRVGWMSVGIEGNAGTRRVQQWPKGALCGDARREESAWSLSLRQAVPPATDRDPPRNLERDAPRHHLGALSLPNCGEGRAGALRGVVKNVLERADRPASPPHVARSRIRGGDTARASHLRWRRKGGRSGRREARSRRGKRRRPPIIHKKATLSFSARGEVASSSAFQRILVAAPKSSGASRG